MENPVFGFLLVIRSQTFDLIDRPVLQLRLNNETPIFSSVLYLLLAHKTIGTNHNNVSRLQGNSSCFAIIVMALSSYFFRGEACLTTAKASFSLFCIATTDTSILVW